MQVILLATGETNKLRPLTNTIPTPLIPVANRPVMVYTLEMLARQGVKQLLVSLYHLAGSIEAYFGDGRRWGVNIEYLLQREAWGSAGALKWAERALTDTFMVIPADKLIDLDIAAVLTQHRTRESAVTVVLQKTGAGEVVCLEPDGRVTVAATASAGGQAAVNTGVYIFERRILSLIPSRTRFDLDQQLLPALLAAGVPVHGRLVGGYWNAMASFADYQAAQHVSLAGSPNGSDGRLFDEAARSLEARQIADSIWVGRNHVIHPSARLAAPVYIGDNCQVGRDVELGPNVVLGKNVIIDDEATVFQSTVLDQTYVGRLVNIDNRIVNKNVMIDVTTAEWSEVVDTFLLSEAHPALLNNGLQRLWHTAVALVFLLLTLPIALPVGLATWMVTGRIIHRITCMGRRPTRRGNGRLSPLHTFSLFRFSACHPNGRPTRFGQWLKKWEFHRLPELWNVIKGDISLVGVKPLQPAETARITEAWQQQRYGVQAGFTGLWYIQTGVDSDLDEILITDTYYVATRTWRDDLKILWQTPGRWLKRRLGNSN